MGGFLVKAPDLEKPIAINADQLLYLIENSYVEYPKLDKADIDDKNKADGLAR